MFSALAATPSSDACGVPTPDVFELSSHYTREGTRLFVVTGETPTRFLAWRALAPGTYDSAQIAESPLGQAMTFTLVGSAGARVVSSKAGAFLKNTFSSREPLSAVEVTAKRSDFAIALRGTHADARWHTAAQIATSDSDAEWIRAQGFDNFNLTYVTVDSLEGDLQAVTVLTKAGTTTLVRAKNILVERFDGRALGTLEVDGERYIVASDKHHSRVIPLY